MAIKDIYSPKGIVIRHLISNDWSMDQMHFHEAFEINISISGGNRFYCNDTLHISEPGDIYIFNDLDLHKNMIRKDMRYERYLIFFPKEVISDIPRMDVDLLELFYLDRGSFKNKFHLNKDQLLHIMQFLNETIFKLNSTFYGKETLSRSRLIELLLMINSFYHQNIGDVKTVNQVKNHISKRVEDTISYINENISGDLNLDILADVALVNKYHLGDLFKKETGFTVNQFIINKRILKAQAYLKKGYSITETTDFIGYHNESHFIRTFKKLVGITPKQYALRHQ